MCVEEGFKECLEEFKGGARYYLHEIALSQ